MQEHAGVGRDVPLALRPRRQQELPHRRRHAHAHRHHVGLNELHRVVDGHACGHRAAGRIDVEVNVLLRVLGGQKQHLGADDVRVVLADFLAKPDDPLLEEPGVNRLLQTAELRRLSLHSGRSAHASSFLIRVVPGRCYPSTIACRDPRFTAEWGLFAVGAWFQRSAFELFEQRLARLARLLSLDDARLLRVVRRRDVSEHVVDLSRRRIERLRGFGGLLAKR